MCPPVESVRRAAFAAVLLLTLAMAASSCAGPIPKDGPAPVASSHATASSAATPSAAATTSVEATPAVDIGWVGDTLVGSRYGMAPRAGRALFEQVADELRRPDLMAGNLEGTLSTAKRSKCDGKDSKVCYAFQAPPAYADSLVWAGFDVMSLANNHAHDYLKPGLEQTKGALSAAGLAYTGLPGQITVREANGVRVAFLGFSPYTWNASIADLPGAQALVRRASAQADVVVVIIHAGAEGSGKTRTPKGTEHAFGEFRGASRAFAHAVIDAGADVVVGSGPHVIRGIERYRGKLVAYSLGNFASWGGLGTGGTLGLSGLLTVRVDKDGTVRGGRWYSLKLTRRGVPAPDPRKASAALVRKLSALDFAERFEMDANGTISVPR